MNIAKITPNVENMKTIAKVAEENIHKYLGRDAILEPLKKSANEITSWPYFSPTEPINTPASTIGQRIDFRF